VAARASRGAIWIDPLMKRPYCEYARLDIEGARKMGHQKWWAVQPTILTRVRGIDLQIIAAISSILSMRIEQRALPPQASLASRDLPLFFRELFPSGARRCDCPKH
jgi:hypothetical protein